MKPSLPPDLSPSPRRHRRAAAVALGGLCLLTLPGCQFLETIYAPRAGFVESREQKADRNLKQARTYLDRGLTDSALDAFSQALQDNPKLVAANMGMGEIYRQRGEYQLASESYEQATRTDPTNFDAHYYLGLMKQLMGQVQEAVSVYLRALAINPDSIKANRDIASAYLQLGKPAEAIPYGKKATELDPDSQPAWSNLAAAYSLTGQYDQAVDAYRQAAELGPLAEPVLLGLADAHIRLGNYARAINTLGTLIRRTDSPVAYERLGYAQFKLRRFEDALRNFRRALDRDKNDTASLNGIGVCLMTLYIEGARENTYQRNEAIKAWRQSLRIDESQTRITDLLARYSRL